MMRLTKQLVLVLAIGLLLVSGHNIFAKGPISGEITNAVASTMQVKVTGFVDSDAWLGCTLVEVQGRPREVDLDAIPISGRFEEIFIVNSAYYTAQKDLKFAVALWGKRVNKCGCIYCQQNTYHLENLIERKYVNLLPGGGGGGW